MGDQRRRMEEFLGNVDIKEFFVDISPKVSLRCFQVGKHKRFTILLYPGYASVFWNWRFFLAGLKEEAVVYYVESREKRCSVASQEVEFDISAFASDINSVVKNIVGPQNYILAASSLNGTAVLHGAPNMDRPPRGLFLILPNRTFRKIPSVGLFLLRLVPRAYLRKFVRLIEVLTLRFRIGQHDVALRDRFMLAVREADERKLTKTALAIHRFTLDLKSLALIEIPCVVVGAADDPMHIQSEIQDIAESLPDAEFFDLKSFARSHGTASARLAKKLCYRVL